MKVQRNDEAMKRRREAGTGSAAGSRAVFRVAALLVLVFVAESKAQPSSAPATSAPAAIVPPRTTGKWLVDLGRDYPLTPQASLGDADAQLTLAFMEAAARVEPTLAEAYMWQHDLLWALNREDEATEALGRYVRLEPDDWMARVLWIAAKTSAIQTIEDRVRFWQDQLKEPNLPGEVSSDLNRRMAEYYYNRDETEAAKKHLTEALKAFPQNLAAERLRIALSADPQDPASRLALALDMVRFSPAQASLAWDVARLLDDISMPREAQDWYRHAIAMFQRANPGRNLPGEFMLDMAASEMDAGLLDAAEILIKDVIKTDGDGPSARRLLARIAGLRRKPDEAKTQLSMARAAYESAWSKVKDRGDPELAAEMAWFYCVEDPKPDRAYELATAAMRAASPGILAQRAFGYAAAQKSMLAEAEKALAPIVRTDSWAAVALAIVKEKGGDNKAAVDLLTRVAERNRTGPIFQEASSMLTALNAPTPPPPGQEKVKQLLADFDESLLLFPVDPKKFLELTVTPLLPLSGELLPGQPLWCRFVLKNKSPFGITLGEDLMVSPTILVMARSSGDRDRDYGGIVRVAMNRRQLLPPGQSLSVTQTLDVGPLRTALIATPQVTQTIEIAAILSPVFVPSQQRWVPRPGGFATVPVQVRRKGVSPDQPGPYGLPATLDEARGGAVPGRVDALDRMMMWLAEQEHLRAGRLKYEARPVNADVLRPAVQERFADPAWEVRAHLAETLRWVTLDAALTQSAAGMLSDSDWLVRMLTVRLFADHQKATFDKVAAYYAESDPDALVRATAAAVRHRWAPATQPATTQPATTAPAAQ